ncbi:MAG: ABC transporter permease [Lachnospiraceae bacterium]|nr:ABC transporter permease [Lachnospiraceae bacterium]
MKVKKHKSASQDTLEKPIPSDRQALYLELHRRHKLFVAFWRFFLLFLFLLFWELGANTGKIDSFFFSSPSRILKLFWELCKDYSIFMHIGITLFETVVSFLLVFIISLVTATLLWYSTKLSEILEPYLVILNSLPKSALAPLFIVWLGTGTTTIIVAGISVALFGSIISFYTGFKQNDEEKLTLIYTLGGSKRDAFHKVVLPGSVPILLATTKVNIGLALVGVIIGEFLAARRGLGYLIIYGSQVFQLNLVITSVILLCLIAMGFYKGLQWIENRIERK